MQLRVDQQCLKGAISTKLQIDGRRVLVYIVSGPCHILLLQQFLTSTAVQLMVHLNSTQ